MSKSLDRDAYKAYQQYLHVSSLDEWFVILGVVATLPNQEEDR